jgi:acetoacetyl-CoA synthetase
LRSWGVVHGDRIAGYLPNIPEAVIAMLAATTIGAVWTSCSPEFGLQAVVDRFGQTHPRILFSAASYQYNGQVHSYLSRIGALLEQVPSIERTVIVPYLDRPGPRDTPAKSLSWEQAVEQGTGSNPRFEQLPFDHPAFILYSSGTTGKPKCIVHGAGGTLLQHLKELVLHSDVKGGDRIFYYTTCAWMMWNWLVSGLAAGATIVLYDGSAMHPRPASLFDLADAEKITAFGVSAKYLSAIEKAGVEPAQTHDLADLRTILSTGSPLSAGGFEYVYNSVKHDVCLSSISGGTDIISCFALGNPIAPVHRGELQARGLGMAVDVFSAEGKPVREGKGELVCTKPFPSMPVGFWDDPDGTKYHDAYFSHFPGVWRHGDWVEITKNDGLVIHGRSDAVLNPGGVRIGTAEIYRIVEQVPEIAESVVVGQEWNDEVRIILFVKMGPQHQLHAELTESIKKRIRNDASPRHVPAKIVAVADIPRTINNKISELAVREVIHGRPVDNAGALLNPESLDLFRNLPELRS